jgi:sortase (surface protein transpeptidase)
MLGATLLTGLARASALPIALALLVNFFPLVAAAQDTEESRPSQVLAEVPTTGARRPGPVILASARLRAPEPRQEGFAPVQMQVESIGLDAPIELGDIVDGAMADPTGPWVVSWYEPLGKVGEGGNVVMSGHVDYWNTGPNGTAGPAVFYEVPKLAPGDIIRLIGENGQTVEYAVEWAKEYDVATELTPEVIQKDIVGNTGQESLTLITCGGEFDAATGEYLKRWVLRANKI